MNFNLQILLINLISIFTGSLANSKFSKPFYKFKLFENESIDTQIGKITVLNPHPSSQTSLNSSIFQLLKLDKSTYELKTLKTLTQSTHSLKAVILDLTTQTVISKCSIQVDVINQTNTSPKFNLNPYQAQIYENNAPDTFVLKVEAFDNDLGDNSRLTYHLILNNDSDTSVYSNPFQIKSDTGEIYAKRVLNREHKHLYSLTVLAIDNGLNRLSTTTQVIVRVLDQRDFQPELDSKVYNLTLSEGMDFTKRPVILRVKGSDKHINNSSALLYSLSGSLNDLNTFEIDQTGQIRLVSKLNYELKNSYKLSIIARDQAQPTCASYSQLNVLIQNSFRNPLVFSAPFYEFILFENVKINTQIGRVYAVTSSTDLGLKYSIDSSLNTPFVIDQSNGVIYTTKQVSKYFKTGYEFYVSVGSEASALSSSVKVKVKILDINDQVPEFSKKSYNLSISEEAAIGLPLLTLHVINKDPNSVLEYSIESEPGKSTNDMFNLIKQGNNRVFLTLERTNLNYKKKSSYEFSIKVMDQDGLYSVSQVCINVTPNNKYSPRFTKDIYSFKINENLPIGSLLGEVTAVASALLENGQIVYKLITNTENLAQSDQANDFKLDEQNGNLYVSNIIDREKYDTVTLYVTAAYRDKPLRTDHAIVHIQIIDSNDNPPVFTRSVYTTNVYLNTDINSYLLRVEAIDKDVGLNSAVKYSLRGSNGLIPVKIDSTTGIIRLASKFDGFKFSDKVNLSLIATDMGMPPQSSSVDLIINFINEEDLPPHFDFNPVEIVVYENQAIGARVGELRARDPDLGHDADIAYKLMNNNELFELKPAGAFNRVFFVLKFTPDEDYAGKVMNVTVRAYSGALFTDCVVRVYVKSLEDVVPVVPRSFRVVFNNYKNYFLTEQSARVPVQDYEQFNNLFFSLTDTIGKQLVNLDQRTGEITLKSILNSNNQINTSFGISINDGDHEIHTTCELIVLMISDTLISESVTLNLYHIDIETFLNTQYDTFINTVLNTLAQQVKKSNIHIFNLVNSSTGINISLSVSYDYEKDLFMPSSTLKQILHSNTDNIKHAIQTSKIQIHEDTSCSIEPCLNFQKCLTNSKFSDASSTYLHSSHIQFRPISIKHDFTCSCQQGFTGKNVSLMCDLEINLCYSNPCGQNGICISLESSFVCICDPDYTGRMCEHDLKASKCCSDPSISSTSPTTTKYLSNRTLSLNTTYQCLNTNSDNRVCRGGSVCKNLILGGILCDKCDSLFYNKFCELRSRNFPIGKPSYLVLPGLQSRIRFKIKLSFTTRKLDSYLFYNGRLDNGLDFIALKVLNGYLRLSYSLGDSVENVAEIRNLSVSDGKWRTVTIEYKNQHLAMSLDNDNLSDTDSCDLAHNFNQSTPECFRTEYFYNLPSKCLNQIETCFRYFDLNGPLILGQSLIKNKLNYEGCISDVYINEKMIDLTEDILLNHNTQIGCSSSTNTQSNNNSLCSKTPCFNSGLCSVFNQSFNCTCPPNFKGPYCQYEKKSSTKISVEKNNNCPAKWWGKEPGICGPCKCDEGKNFSPDCNQTTGLCECKSKFYKKVNKQTKEEICVPCECYLEGSTSLQCEPMTGQCNCIPGAGITGRKCDQCVSPLAEMTLKGNECRQLNTNECPRSIGFNILWPRTPFNSIANSSCPRGSTGTAFRSCSENGWSNDLDLSECKSLKIIDSQLLKLAQEIYLNKSQLNSYQAFKLVEDLYKITGDAEVELDDSNFDDDYHTYMFRSAHSDSWLSTGVNTLYASDLIVIKNLTKSIIDFEVENAPSFLYIQDKHFLKKLFTILNRILSKKYDLKLSQYSHRFSVNKLNGMLTDCLLSIDRYLKVIVKYNKEYSMRDEEEIEIGLSNLNFGVKSVRGEGYTDFVRFRLAMDETGSNKVSFVSLNTASDNLPRNLLLQSFNKKNGNSISSLKYRVVSNTFLLNIEKTNTSFYALVEFSLTNNYDTVYDSKSNLINYRNLKTVKSDLSCVYLNTELGLWSSKNAKLVSYDPSTNTVKCQYEANRGIYAVLSPVGSFIKNDQSPINFSIVFNVFMCLSLTILCMALFTLALLKKVQTPLTIVYTNVCLNMLLNQFIFYVGVNLNESQLICKLISILQHYFNITTYIWMLIISLHLYRMLTELRDINKVGSALPVFYYVIGYVAPSIIVSITLGIKQDVYTNYDLTLSFLNYPISKLDLSSVYCWLNINNFTDIFFIYILPITIVVFLFLCLTLLSYKEIQKNTFKQTDLKLVYQSLIGSLILLPFNCAITVCLLLFLNAASTTGQLANLVLNEANIYQHLFLIFSVCYSILAFVILVLCNKQNKAQLGKMLNLLLTKFNPEKKLIIEDNLKKPCFLPSELPNGHHLTNKSIEVINVNQVKAKYLLDYQDFKTHNSNSASTTTTDEYDSHSSDYLKQNYIFMPPGASHPYLSNLINTTNTDTTANESDYNYNYDFNRPEINNTDSIQECDVVDVAKVLKTRNFGYQVEDQSDLQLSPSNLANGLVQINNVNNAGFGFKKESKYYNVTDGKISQPVFWPNAIAECDSSFLEGSDVYTPSKLPYVKNIELSKNISYVGNHSPINRSNTSPASKSSVQSEDSVVNIGNYKIATVTRPMSACLGQPAIQSPVQEE